MPKLLDPDCTFKVVLKSDEDKTNPPAFCFKALSVRTFNHVVDRYESIDELDSDIAQVRAIVDCLKIGMVDWENMGRDYDPENLDEILTINESIELLEKMLAGQQVGGDDAKN